MAWICVARVFAGKWGGVHSVTFGSSVLLKHSYVDEINGKYIVASALSRRSHAMLSTEFNDGSVRSKAKKFDEGTGLPYPFCPQIIW